VEVNGEDVHRPPVAAFAEGLAVFSQVFFGRGFLGGDGAPNVVKIYGHFGWAWMCICLTGAGLGWGRGAAVGTRGVAGRWGERAF